MLKEELKVMADAAELAAAVKVASEMAASEMAAAEMRVSKRKPEWSGQLRSVMQRCRPFAWDQGSMQAIDFAMETVSDAMAVKPLTPTRELERKIELDEDYDNDGEVVKDVEARSFSSLPSWPAWLCNFDVLIHIFILITFPC